ncbi:helix-turn-helix domain-containing protein [Thalassospira sp. MA62]|nr:helix-turn-helix domain-containing protein [Thalassospira sp. MA62]
MLEAIDVMCLAVSVVGTAQAIFLIVLLMDEGKRAFAANRWLMVFAFSVGMSLVDDIFSPLIGPLANLYMVPVFAPFFFAFLPSIYLYFREISGDPAPRPYRHFLVLLPVAAMISLMVYLKRSALIVSQDVARGIRPEIAFNADGLDDVILLAAATLFCVLFFVYMFGIWNCARRYLRRADWQLQINSQRLRRWLVELLVGMTILFSVFTLTHLFDLFVARAEWLALAVRAAFVIVFFRMCQVIAQNPALFVQSESQTGGTVGREPLSNRANGGNDLHNRSDMEQKSSVLRSVADDDHAARIQTRLQKVVSDHDMIFDPLLTMPKLAAEIGVSPNQLSFVLNQHLGKSFFDFVNEVRVDAAMCRLLEQPNKTVLAIATEVGFNSKSTFNQAFKKIAGCTPSTYRKQNTGPEVRTYE